MQHRDEREAEELKLELKRLFELDRQHRLRNGAAETNLAALRERVRERRATKRERGRGGERQLGRQIDRQRQRDREILYVVTAVEQPAG